MAVCRNEKLRIAPTVLDRVFTLESKLHKGLLEDW
jgi:hypothetical protein